MEKKIIGELAYDIQTGLGSIDVPDFENLRTIGMAATLAVHIRGLGEIDYTVLRNVSEHYFSIPSYALREVLEVLAEIEYVQLTTTGKKIKSILPDVPRFQNIYEGVGEYLSNEDLNEPEQATLAIMSELQSKPDNNDRLIHTTGIDRGLFKRCVDIGEAGTYIKSFRARGKDILASPFYFADNLDALVDTTARIGATEIQSVLNVVKGNQGWPLSLIEKRLELGGTKITPSQKDLLTHLCNEGVLKPPSLKFSSTSETFVFTPSPGAGRLNAANREVYERAMALVSCVRKGQLLPNRYRIRSPLRLLEALRDRGHLGANSEANSQYRNLVLLRVGNLINVGGDRWEFRLYQTEENQRALKLAIDLFRTGELSDLEVNEDAKIALTKDEKYIQSVISASELKQRKSITLNEQAAEEFEQLILAF